MNDKILGSYTHIVGEDSAIPAVIFLDDNESEICRRELKKKSNNFNFTRATYYAQRVVWRLKRYKSLKYLGEKFTGLSLDNIDYISCEVCGNGPLIPIAFNCSGVDVICLNCGSEDEWTW